MLAVISHENAPRLAEVADGELMLFQSDQVAYRGADRRRGRRRLAARPRRRRRPPSQIDYDAAEHDVELRPGHPRLYKPDKVNPAFPTDIAHGDLDAGLAAAEVVVDATYTTPPIHNNPMEPHASLARLGRTATSRSTTRSRARGARAATSPRCSSSSPSGSG